MKRPIVIKVGTSALLGRKKGEAIDTDLVKRLAKTIYEIEKRLNKKIILVSSGAMGLGISKLGLDDQHDAFDDKLDFKAAITAIGQVELMNIYGEAFSSEAKKHVGQILITDYALEEAGRQKRVLSSVKNLFELNVLPIFNENDTVCPDEIEYGDNDKLSANIAVLVNAERLIILTDCDGLYEADPYSNPDAKLITNVEVITDEIKDLAGSSSSRVGLGGMNSKVMAAEVCMAKGIKTNIVNKEYLQDIVGLLEGSKTFGTEFASSV